MTVLCSVYKGMRVQKLGRRTFEREKEERNKEKEERGEEEKEEEKLF